MILLRKLNGTQFALNCDLIESINSNPDTTIRLSNGNVYIVNESVDEIIQLTIDYKKKIFSDMLSNLKEN